MSPAKHNHCKHESLSSNESPRLRGPMGASQSKLPEPIIQEKLAERLQALLVKDLQQESERDYVYIDQEQKLLPSEYSPTVSISAAEQWERELLEDPKACCFPRIPSTAWKTS